MHFWKKEGRKDYDEMNGMRYSKEQKHIISSVTERLSDMYGLSYNIGGLSKVLGFRNSTQARASREYAAAVLQLYVEGRAYFFDRNNPDNHNEEAMMPVWAHSTGIDYAIDKLQQRRNPKVYKTLVHPPHDMQIIQGVTSELIRRRVGQTPYAVSVATGSRDMNRYEDKILGMVRGEKIRYMREEVPADDHHDPEDDAEKLAILRTIQELHMTAVLSR